jgi:hypothetical protein
MKFRGYAYGWITLGLFVFSLAGHWLFGWFAYVNEQETHNVPVAIAGYLIEMARDTFENWQSEFLQLLWQVGGLALFLYIGSPSSKEGDDRHEAKLDAIIRQLAPQDGDRMIQQIDEEFARK